jgi:bifunctional non-homologous end joining protein LigD
VITHPDKMLFPDDGITKGDLATYYQAIAPVMLPHLGGRPVTMERYPAGIGKKGFWQKDVSKGFPEWLQRVEVPKRGGVVHHAIVTDVRSLLWATNQNTVTQHVWTSRVPDLDHPDIPARWRVLRQRRCSAPHYAERRHDSAQRSCRLSCVVFLQVPL